MEGACAKEYIPLTYPKKVESISTFCKYLSGKQKQAYQPSLSEARIKGSIHKLPLGIGEIQFGLHTCLCDLFPDGE